mmetsp:Transcript_14178/g.42420  ORF Transcript_14178/g.42420 Transcript_14178/m.42420 type:complete len:205 (-) Transcript_14178:1468-2082(-)
MAQPSTRRSSSSQSPPASSIQCSSTSLIVGSPGFNVLPLGYGFPAAKATPAHSTAPCIVVVICLPKSSATTSPVMSTMSVGSWRSLYSCSGPCSATSAASEPPALTKPAPISQGMSPAPEPDPKRCVWMRPPSRPRASSTKTLTPSRVSCWAALRPATPPPKMATTTPSAAAASVCALKLRFDVAAASVGSTLEVAASPCDRLR